MERFNLDFQMPLRILKFLVYTFMPSFTALRLDRVAARQLVRTKNNRNKSSFFLFSSAFTLCLGALLPLPFV